MIQACLVGVKGFRSLLNEVADVETTSELGRRFHSETTLMIDGNVSGKQDRAVG